MKTEIVFCNKKMLISAKSGKVKRFYGELMYIKYEKPYCVFHFKEGPKYWIEVPLQYMIDNLPDATFLVCKRSAILNLIYFKNFTANPPMIEMLDGEKFKLSKQNALKFNEMLSQLPQLSPLCPICYPCKNETCKSQALFCRRNKTQQNNEPKTE